MQFPLNRVTDTLMTTTSGSSSMTTADDNDE